MLYCPNLSNPETKEIFDYHVELFGENNAYRLWYLNKGNPLDKAPNGKDSIIFKELFEHTENFDEALLLKAKLYEPEFAGHFGNWTSEDGIKKHPLDSNGEPILDKAVGMFINDEGVYKYEEVKRKGKETLNDKIDNEIAKGKVYHQLDTNYKTKLLAENELLPPDPHLDKKMEDFLKSKGLTLKGDTLPGVDWVAMTDMVEGIVQVVEGKKNLSTLAEESAHVFVELLPENSPLLKKMMGDIEKFKGYDEVFEKYKKKYITFEDGKLVPDVDMIKKEAIGKLIAREIIKQHNNESADNISLLKRWFDRVINWLKTKLGKNATQEFQEQVGAYKEAARMILENKIPDNITELSSIKERVYVKPVKFYQMDDADVMNYENIKNYIENPNITLTPDGYMVLKTGEILPTRASDIVQAKVAEKFDFGDKQNDDKIPAMKGTYVHKIIELIIKDIQELDPNQDRDIDIIQNYLHADGDKNYKAKAKRAAEALIKPDSEFYGMSVDDAFFRLGKYNKRTGSFSNEALNYRKLSNVALYIYNNIREKQASINRATSTNGKAIIKTELPIYDQINNVGTTIDLFVLYSNGMVAEYDWKTIQFKNKDKKISDYKQLAFDVAGSVHKTAIKNATGATKFAETRFIPIEVAFDFKTPEKGFYDIKTDYGQRDPELAHLEPIPFRDEYTNNIYLDNALNRLFQKREEFEKLIASKKGATSKNKASLERIKGMIKAIQLRREFGILTNEVKGLIGEFSSREHHSGTNVEITTGDIVKYQEYADLYSNILSDIINSIDTEATNESETFKDEANKLIGELSSFKQRLNSKTVDKLVETTGIDLSQPGKEEHVLGRYLKGLFDFSQPAFKAVRTLTGRMQNSVRMEFNAIEQEVSKITNNLWTAAKQKGMSKQEAFNYFIDDTGTDTKLKSKYNDIYWKEKQEATEKENAEWFKDNALVTKSADTKTGYAYRGDAADKFDTWWEAKQEEIRKEFKDDLAKEGERRIEYLAKKYDIANHSEAMFNEKNFFIKPLEQDRFYSDFWKDITSKGNEAFLDYYEMYIKYNELFRDKTNADFSGRFISHVAKDLLDSVSELGIAGFGNMAGMLKKSIEVRQNDDMKGTVYNGEAIRQIPLLFSDPLLGEVTKKDREEIKKRLLSLKDDAGKPLYKEGVVLNQKVEKEAYKLSLTRGKDLKSRDLSKSLMLFANSALTYEYAKESEDLVTSVLFFLKSGGGSHYATDRFGNKKRDAYDNILNAVPGIPADEVKMYESFIDSLWYGRTTQSKDKVIRIGKKDYSVTKMVKLLMRHISVKALGLNAFVATGSAIQSFTSLAMTGMEDRYFKNAISKSMKMIREDYKKFKTLSGIFEAYSFDPKYIKANNLASGKLSKLITMDNLFIMQKNPDMFMDEMLTASMAHRYGVENGKLVKLKTDNESNSIVNLVRYDKENDRHYIEGLSNEDFVKFRQMVIHQSTRINGMTSGENARYINMFLMGQMLMQFRGWMPGLTMNRMAELDIDPVMEEANVGRFIVFNEEFIVKGGLEQRMKSLWNFTKELLLIRSYDAKSENLNMDAAIYYYNRFISENPQHRGKLSLQDYLKLREDKLRGMAAEIRMWLTMVALVNAMRMFMFGSKTDDEKESRIAEFYSRNAYRLANRGLLEMSFFFDPAATFRSFVYSPAAVLRLPQDMRRLYQTAKKDMAEAVTGEYSPYRKTHTHHLVAKQIPLLNQGIEFFDFFGTWDVGLGY